MKTLIFVLKGILLWVTFLSVIFVAMAIDSMSDTVAIVTILIEVALILSCYKWLTIDEVEILSGSRLF